MFKTLYLKIDLSSYAIVDVKPPEISLVCMYLRDMYLRCSVEALPRHSDNSTLCLPTGRSLQNIKDSFQYSSAEIWNKIPVEIREAQSLLLFNSDCIQWFLTKNP